MKQGFYSKNHVEQMIEGLAANILHQVDIGALPAKLCYFPGGDGAAIVMEQANKTLSADLALLEIFDATEADIIVIPYMTQAMWAELAANNIKGAVFFLVHERHGLKLKQFDWFMFDPPVTSGSCDGIEGMRALSDAFENERTAPPAPLRDHDATDEAAYVAPSDTFPPVSDASPEFEQMRERHEGCTWEHRDAPHSNRTVLSAYPATREEQIEYHIRSLLMHLGEDADREGLVETPARVRKAFEHWFSGYGKDPKSVLKVFTDGAEDCDSMVVVKDIPFFSHCEHHMAPFFGTATIAYIPNMRDKKIVGLSKLSRLLDIFARRLQVQERLTSQVANILYEELDAVGVGVVIKARHLCMESRGVSQQGHFTITSALRGKIKSQPAVRAEFMALTK